MSVYPVIDVNSIGLTANIGDGLNTFLGTKMGAVATGYSANTMGASGQTRNYSLSLVTTKEQLYSALDISASASYSSAGLSASGQASYAESTTIDDSSQVLVVKCTILNSTKSLQQDPTSGVEPALVPGVAANMRVSTTAYADYGDAYISGVTVGGSFYGIITILSSKVSSTTNVAASVSGSYAGASATASLTSNLNDVDQNYITNVQAFFSGVDPSFPNPTTIPELITALQNFPAAVGTGGVVQSVTVADFGNLPGGITLGVAEQRNEFQNVLPPLVLDAQNQIANWTLIQQCPELFGSTVDVVTANIASLTGRLSYLTTRATGIASNPLAALIALTDYVAPVLSATLPVTISVWVYEQNNGFQAYPTPAPGGTVTAGTQGQGLELEGIQFNLVSSIPGVNLGSLLGIEYRAWVKNIGNFPRTPSSLPLWSTGGSATGSASDPGYCGTQGASLRIEAFWVQLTGKYAGLFDVNYQAYVPSAPTQAYNSEAPNTASGWLGFVKNGTMAGTEGDSLAVECIQINVQWKSQS